MSSTLRTLGWAAYLGISWTWCIGMFLPILLMRDFGWWAFLVFAIPNVVGAAAMGWVLRSHKDAAAICDDHRPAVRAFTLVTIAFHCFWLGWMVWVISPWDTYRWPDGSRVLYPLVLAAAVLVVGTLALTGRHLVSAALLWVASLGLGTFAVMGGWDELTGERSQVLNNAAPASIFVLAPVCVFGFLLCPYLDATFLRARRAAGDPGARTAFGVGFGVVFFSMILLTLGYSGVLEPAITSLGGPRLDGAVTMVLFPHFLLQSVFTVLVHLRALPGGYPRGVAARLGFALVCVALLILGGFVDQSMYAGLSLGEVIYRGFMAFYGLVFPAYVWVCMIPTRDGHAGTAGERGRRKLMVLAAAVVLATPCYWMGFIERETWWLAPGLGIVLLARVVVKGKRGVRVGEAGEDSARGGL